MNKLLGLFLLLLVSAGFAATITIPTCGSYSDGSAGDTFQFSANFDITSASTITSGACVYIRLDYGTSSSTQIIDFNEKVINQTNGSATYFLLINASISNLGVHNTQFKNNINVSNVPYFIHLLSQADIATARTFNFAYNTAIPRISLNNVSYPLYLNCAAPNATCNFQANSAFNFSTCEITNMGQINDYNITNARWANLSKIILSNASGCGTPLVTAPNIKILQTSPRTTAGYSILPFLAFGSNKLFSSNGVITSADITSSIGKFKIANTTSFATTNASTEAYYSIGLFTTNYVDTLLFLENISLEDTTGIGNLTLKKYYCASGYCNPLVFTDYYTFPFYINVPETLAPVVVNNLNYTKIEFYWKQGEVTYLVASSANNIDTTFYLLPSGYYEINVTNSTTTTLYNATITCSYSQYSTCILEFTDTGAHVYSSIPKLPYYQICTNLNSTYIMKTKYSENVSHRVEVNYTDNSSDVNITDAFIFEFSQPLTDVRTISYTVNNQTVCLYDVNKSNFLGIQSLSLPNETTKMIIGLPLFLSTIAISTQIPLVFAFAFAWNDMFQLLPVENVAIIGVIVGVLSIVTNWFGERNLKTLLIYFVLAGTFLINYYAFQNQPFTYSSNLGDSIEELRLNFENFDLYSLVLALPTFIIDLVVFILALPLTFYDILFSLLTTLHSSFSVLSAFKTALVVATYLFIALKGWEIVKNQFRSI